MNRHERLRDVIASRPDWVAAVLLVDDMALHRASIGRLLESWGWSVAMADSGEAAFSMLCAGRYGCVLSDHAMPAGDGLSLVQRWAAILDPQTPVLIQTSENAAEVLSAYRSLGVPVLAKGAAPTTVQTWVRQALAGRCDAE